MHARLSVLSLRWRAASSHGDPCSARACRLPISWHPARGEGEADRSVRPGPALSSSRCPSEWGGSKHPTSQGLGAGRHWERSTELGDHLDG